MDRDKQIEEMARVACVGFHEGDCEHCPRKGFCSSYTVSRKLYRNGWRKASDVASEIFEEIYRAHEDCIVILGDMGYLQPSKFVQKIAELKKKYIGEDINVTTKTEDN